ncbi:reverse transcriptase [Phytophthora palmivora]|uniref:Reverse transcriptase n=1 Tax=Phytophthora palmivora TaxID=4796 RepID=A0A2P4X4D2_9STRA|nr:reverse transcriptase [Phytophthora palmivora]
MAWLERHEPWIDWKSETLGATHVSPAGALASHEPTSAKTQKRYWREHWTGSVSLLGVGVAELVNACVGDTSPELGATLTTPAGPERSSLDERGVARNPLGGVGPTRDAPPRVQVDAVGNEPRFHGLRPDENCVVARTPLSSSRPEGKLLRARLSVGDGILGAALLIRMGWHVNHRFKGMECLVARETLVPAGTSVPRHVDGAIVMSPCCPLPPGLGHGGG